MKANAMDYDYKSPTNNTHIAVLVSYFILRAWYTLYHGLGFRSSRCHLLSYNTYLCHRVICHFYLMFAGWYNLLIEYWADLKNSYVVIESDV